MFQEKVRIFWNEKIAEGYYKIGFDCPELCCAAQPGQFVMLRLTEHHSPLLRRPFSIHGLISTCTGLCGIELLYKVVGEGTARLSLCRQGDKLDVLGPLGKGFSFPEKLDCAYVVAGGVGVAPMLFLLSALKSRKKMAECRVFLGGRTQNDILCSEAFERFGAKLEITTEDGSIGEKALVTQSLNRAIQKRHPDMIYACGPNPMLKAISDLAENKNISCELSLESHMACGMGACLGCAVPKSDASDTYLHVCVDGPVVNSRKIKF